MHSNIYITNTNNKINFLSSLDNSYDKNYLYFFNDINMTIQLKKDPLISRIYNQNLFSLINDLEFLKYQKNKNFEISIKLSEIIKKYEKDQSLTKIINFIEDLNEKIISKNKKYKKYNFHINIYKKIYLFSYSEQIKTIQNETKEYLKQNTFNSELFNIISKYTDIRFISTSFIGMIESSLSKNSEKNIHKANHFIIHFIHSHIIATILNNPNIKVIDIDDTFLNLMYLDNNLSLDTIKVFIDSLKMILNDYKCQSKKLSLQNNDFYKYICEVSNQYFNFIPFSICFEYIMNYNYIVRQENFKNFKKLEGFDSTGIVTDFYSNTIFDLYGLFSAMKFLNDNNHISIFISNDKGFDYLGKLYQISILNKKFKFKYNLDLDYKLLHNDKYRHLFIIK